GCRSCSTSISICHWTKWRERWVSRSLPPNRASTEQPDGCDLTSRWRRGSDMTNERFRRDLNRALEAMSGPPSPALAARVRSALSEPAPARPRPFWVAGLAAALIAAIVIGGFVVSNLNRHLTSGVPGTVPSASPSAIASASPSVTPTPIQTPPDSSLPPFDCGSSAPINSQNGPVVSFIDAVRAGTHTGYDRITIEFQNGQPSSIELRPQGNSTFTQGASGQMVTLAGSAGLLVVIKGADEHTAYSGATDFKTNYSVLLEARQMEDFEGTVQWGLGLSKSACHRAFFLTNPTRLVIDIQTG